MKLFELCIGDLRRLVPAESAEEARRIGQDPTKHPDIHFMPFEVREFVLPGYVITVTPEAGAQVQEDVPPDDSDEPNERERLKEILTARGIEYKKNWSTDKLRELVEQTAAAATESDPKTPDNPDALS
jgi:hypothetical protein